MSPVYILKNYHNAEGGSFRIYDAEYRLIEERWMTFAEAKALKLTGVSPYQASQWEATS